MIQEIRFNGITRNPGPYECPDGDLAVASGLVYTDGALHTSGAPSVVLPPDSFGSVVVCTHQTPQGLHYILQSRTTDGTTTVIRWSTPDGHTTHLHTFDHLITIHQYTVVGNTLILLTSEGPHYFLWGMDDLSYTHLGTHIPELPVTFALHESDIMQSDEFRIALSIKDDDDYIEFPESAELDTLILGKVDKLINDAAEKGRFIFPFLVRYAYRLYDGSLTMHSAPVLMTCSSYGAPVYAAISVLRGRIKARTFSLEYFIRSQHKETLAKWGDIIKSVDIFVSRPIQSYDPSGHFIAVGKVPFTGSTESLPLKVRQIAESYYVSGKLVFSPGQDETGSFTEPHLVYKKHRYIDSNIVSPLEYDTDRYAVGVLPTYTDEEFQQQVRDCHSFFLIHTIDVPDLTTDTLQTIKVDKYRLPNLVTYEAMTDDFESHDYIIPTIAHTFNGRLNVAGADRQIFDGHHTAALLQYTGTDTPITSLSTVPADHAADPLPITFVAVTYHIREDGREFITRPEAGTMASGTPITYLFHPNPRVYQATISLRSADGTRLAHYVVPMRRHQTLYGSVFSPGFSYDITTQADVAPVMPSPTPSTLIHQPSRLYTSEVNNPFIFPAVSTNTIGHGQILALSTAARALSQGQFGQFPLYAFTTEGVWALQLSASGSFTAVQPITRDVILPDTQPCQLDDAVLFATARGLMLLSGSTTACISDILDGDTPSIPDLTGITAHLDLPDSHLHASDITLQQILPGCGIIYAYATQRIIVFHPDHLTAFVYSLRSKQWSTMPSTIATAIPSYPDALAVLHDRTLVTYGTMLESTDADSPSASISSDLIVTRPFKLDTGFSLKTIDTLMLRGNFDPAQQALVLYGSNDATHWFPISSSRSAGIHNVSGTPWRYFTLVIFSRLTRPRHYICGCTVSYTLRRNNHLR